MIQVLNEILLRPETYSEKYNAIIQDYAQLNQIAL